MRSVTRRNYGATVIVWTVKRCSSGPLSLGLIELWAIAYPHALTWHIAALVDVLDSTARGLQYTIAIIQRVTPVPRPSLTYKAEPRQQYLSSSEDSEIRNLGAGGNRG